MLKRFLTGSRAQRAWLLCPLSSFALRLSYVLIMDFGPISKCCPVLIKEDGSLAAGTYTNPVQLRDIHAAKEFAHQLHRACPCRRFHQVQAHAFVSVKSGKFNFARMNQNQQIVGQTHLTGAARLAGIA